MKYIKSISSFFQLQLLLLSSAAIASVGEGLPFEAPLEAIANSLSGPVARAVGIIAICGAGLMAALNESGSLYTRIGKIILGLAIVFSASTWGLSFLGFGSGALLP